MGEVEGGEVVAASQFGAERTPVEAASDHQMQDKPDVVFEADGDTLTDAAEFADGLAFCGGDGRLRGAQQEWGGDADVFEALVEDAALDGGDVGGDVG